MKSPFSGGEAILQQERSTITFRKEPFEYIRLFWKCPDTGEIFTTTRQDEINLNQVYNQYRIKYGIPFPDEITTVRSRYGLSAVKMSEILGFGDNQYRLYENGEMPSETNGKVLHSIQNPNVFEIFVNNAAHQFSQKELETIKSKLAKFRENYELTKKTEKLIFEDCPRSIFNGYAQQSYDRLKNIILFFIRSSNGIFNTKMNKLLFYSDFLSYKSSGYGLTGLTYKAIQYGPVPVKWNIIYGLIEGVEAEIITFPSGYSGTRLVTDEEPNLSAFTADEKNTLLTVLNHFKNTNANEISEISHLEEAWLKYNQTGLPIDFSLAFALKAI